MADIVNATIHSQISPETTSGTPVAATKQMLSFGFQRWTPKGDGIILTPQGYKVPVTVVPPGRTWVEGVYDGVFDFNEIEYVLNSLINTVSPVANGTNGKRWTHSITKDAVDPKTTFTWEQGNTQHAQRAPYMFFNSGKFEMTPLMQKISGNVMAQALTDDITLTSSPTILTPQVIPPQSFDVRIASTQAALVGTAQVETATAAGTVSGSGNANVVFISAAVTGSPVTVPVAVLNTDTPAVWGPKVVTALAANAAINAAFNITGSTTSIVATARNAAANDATLNIAIDTGTATGITTAATSANTTAGVAPASVYARPFSVIFDIPNVQDVLFRMNSGDTSFINTQDIPIAPIATFRTDADDAGMGYLANWLAGSQTFISVTATGGAIAGAQASTYAFTLICSCRIIKPYNPAVDRGNAQADWAMDLVYDPTWQNILSLITTNTLAAL